MSYKKYALDYTGDPYAYAHLQKVTQYSSQNIAINPTVFTWTSQNSQFTQSSYSPTLEELVFPGDFNGDGREDLVTVPNRSSYTSNDKWKLYLADASGNMVYTTQGDLNTSFKTFTVNDFNGDGLTDLMMQENDTPANYYLYRSTGTNFIRNSSGYSCPNKNNFDVVDYNGDGILEFFYYQTTGNWYLYNYSGTLITNGSIPSFGKLLGSDKPQNKILDFNGDGCSDLLVFFLNSYKIYEFKGTNKALISLYPSGTNIAGSDYLIFGDYNGDGSTDILRSEPVPMPWYLMFLTSSGFQENFMDDFDFSTDFISNNSFYTRDINGDGNMDIILIGKGFNSANPINRINVAISSGTHFYTTEYISSVSFSLDNRYLKFGDFDGDGRDQLFFKNAVNSQLYSFASGTPDHLINTVIDGLGAKTTLTYLPMSNINVYSRGSGATYPVSDFSSAMQLVSQVSSDNGKGGTETVAYQYAGAKLHRQGKGFLTFSKITATNGATGVSRESNYIYDETYYFPKIQTVYTKRGSITLSTITNLWGNTIVLDPANRRIFPYIFSNTETDNLTKLSVTSTVDYYSDCNLKSVTKDYGEGHTQKTEYQYNDEQTYNWLIGRPTTITETSQKGTTTNTFVTTRTYFEDNNSPDIDEYNTGDDAYWKLNRDYDVFGNLWKEHKYTPGITEQTTVYSYWVNNVNVGSVTDPTGNKTTYDYYPATGLLHAQRDTFTNMVVYNYDGNDQLASVIPTEGVSTTASSSFDVTGGPVDACYYVQQSGGDGSEIKTWYDLLGRELRSETKKFGGQYVKVDKQYNIKGQLEQVSEPFTGTASSWNQMSYHSDSGRLTSSDPYFGPTTTINYPDSVISRTVNGRNYSETVNAAGWTTKRTDPGGTIVYKYFPNGTLRSTLAPGNVTTSMTYDKNGNRLTISDPSSGVITNTWYGMGQPKTQQNGRGQTITYTYQADGLLDYYTASPADEGQTNYTYNDKKQVSNITSPGGVSRTYSYDTKGRVSAISESIDGVSNEVSYTYDAKGRLYQKYFNGTSDYEQYDYDTNSGYLYRIQFNGVTVWQLTTMDEYLRVRQANIGTTSASWSYDGNNLLSQVAASGVQQYDYSFDVNTGNLTSRTNYLKSKTEIFDYGTDNLDRLCSVTGPVGLSLTYTADKNGNILTKEDAGTYVYDATQPYAVDQVTGGQNISTTQQDVSYYSFEKVKLITEGTKTAEFVYNADQQRIRMILKTNGTATKTRWYFGSSCERELAGGVTTQYIWIGGDAYTAKAVAKKVGTGTWTIYNIFRDHLGTITHLKDATTGTITEYSFDAWGRRRDKDDWTMTLTSEPALFADRGFTSHEYLEDFKLYNMNGRLYDPVVGRFLNADPVVQDPGNTQSYNRYSYCLNNPLKYSDPSGCINQNPLPRQEPIGKGGGSISSWMDDFGEPGTGYWGDPWGSSYYGSHLTSHLNKPETSYNFNYTLKVLKNSDNGGFWSRSTGIVKFKSNEEAFMAGCLIIGHYGYWAGTIPKNQRAANFAYSLASSDPNFTASTDGTIGTDLNKPNKWMKNAGVFAISASFADGPIPIGEILGVSAVTIALIHDALIKNDFGVFGDPKDWKTSRDQKDNPEFLKLDTSNDYYNPWNIPPKWFWPFVGAAGYYEYIKNVPKIDTTKLNQPNRYQPNPQYIKRY